MMAERMLNYRLLLILLLPFVGACAYERVDILVGGDIYNGTILSHRDDVEVLPGMIVLKPGARFAIKTFTVTQWLGQFDVAIRSGEGMNAYLRTVPDKFDSSKGVAFRYAVDGCSLRTAEGRTIPLDFNAETEPQTLSFYNEAELLSIAVGCTKLFEEEIETPATEYIIFETLPGSTVELRSATYFNTDVE